MSRGRRRRQQAKLLKPLEGSANFCPASPFDNSMEIIGNYARIMQSRAEEVVANWNKQLFRTIIGAPFICQPSLAPRQTRGMQTTRSPSSILRTKPLPMKLFIPTIVHAFRLSTLDIVFHLLRFIFLAIFLCAVQIEPKRIKHKIARCMNKISLMLNVSMANDPFMYPNC
jgi:hypothetical protein